MAGLRMPITTILRATDSSVPKTRFRAQSTRSQARAAAFFHTTRVRQRYGTAKEPAAHLKGENEETEDDKPMKENSITPDVEVEQAVPETKSLPAPKDEPSSAQTSDQSASSDPPAEPKSPLDRVLDMESPNAPEDEKPPHLQAPPYVHHFDTWSLVRDLQSGGFSGDQTVTIMKGVRSILADNMNLATRALVSKSNVENELYLFRAACSELKAEIQNARKAEADRWRSQRAQLQHEVDILGQTLTQEAGSMKDELKGLFDDRKMLTRGEQKKVEAKIQELNYKITVALNSDARSNIESLRWILTRRAILALVIAGGMVIGTLNYSRYMTGVQEAERKKHTADMAAVEHDSVAVQKGSIHGLAEEMLLAPEGVSNG